MSSKSVEPEAKRARSEGNDESSAIELALSLDADAFERGALEVDDETFTLLERKIAALSLGVTEAGFKRVKNSDMARAQQHGENIRRIYDSAHISDDTRKIPTEAVRSISSFLKITDKIKFSLMTCKAFVKDLGYETLWKDIFEAVWKNSLVGDSTKFEKIIEERGYDWMFKQMFLKKPISGDPRELGATVTNLIRTPSLSHRNTFLLLSLITSKNGGQIQAFHSIVIDKETLLQIASGRGLLLGLPQPAVQVIKETTQGDDPLCIKVFAFRMDTNECCLLFDPATSEIVDEVIAFGDMDFFDDFDMYDDSNDVDQFPLNHEGQQLLSRMLGPAEGRYMLNFRIEISHVKKGITLSVQWLDCRGNGGSSGDFGPRHGVSLFHILDYGVQWNPT